MCVNMAESDRQHASTMESLEESDTASLDLSCESSIFDEEEVDAFLVTFLLMYMF
jgi:hypothetical protein